MNWFTSRAFCFPETAGWLPWTEKLPEAFLKDFRCTRILIQSLWSSKRAGILIPARASEINWEKRIVSRLWTLTEKGFIVTPLRKIKQSLDMLMKLDAKLRDFLLIYCLSYQSVDRRNLFELSFQELAVLLQLTNFPFLNFECANFLCEFTFQPQSTNFKPVYKWINRTWFNFPMFFSCLAIRQVIQEGKPSPFLHFQRKYYEIEEIRILWISRLVFSVERWINGLYMMSTSWNWHNAW